MYEEVKALVFAHSKANIHMSYFVDDENAQAVLDMGKDAVPHLFRLMREHPFESSHFGFATIQQLVPMPDHIRNKLTPIRGHVEEMESVYLEWEQEYERG